MQIKLLLTFFCFTILHGRIEYGTILQNSENSDYIGTMSESDAAIQAAFSTKNYSRVDLNEGDILEVLNLENAYSSNSNYGSQYHIIMFEDENGFIYDVCRNPLSNTERFHGDHDNRFIVGPGKLYLCTYNSIDKHNNNDWEDFNYDTYNSRDFVKLTYKLIRASTPQPVND